MSKKTNKHLLGFGSNSPQFKMFSNMPNAVSFPDIGFYGAFASSNFDYLECPIMFQNCPKLTELRDSKYYPEGKRWNFVVSIDISGAPLNRVSILKIFNGLETKTETQTVQTITISSVTNSYLTQEDRAIVSLKRWTLAVA